MNKRISGRLYLRSISSLAVGLSWASVLFAADKSDWSVFVGAYRTDNVELSPTNKRSDTQPRAGFTLDFRDDRERLDTDLAANISYEGYTSRYYTGLRAPDTITGAANLSLTASIIPRRFLWTTVESFGQTAVDLAAANSPGNRQNTNVFSTGPRVTFPLGARNELQFVGNYFTSSFRTSTSDSSGYSASAALRRQISRGGSLSLHLAESRIQRPSQNGIGDSKVHSAYFGWDRIGERGSLLMELGYTSLDAQSITEHSPLVRVTFTRRLSARSTISLTGAREFSSAAETFQSNLTFFGVAGTLANGRASGEPFRSDYGLVSWTTTGNILDLAVRARLRRETYQTNTTLNARLFGAGVAVNRAISPRLRVGLRADYDRRQFTAQQNDTREQRIGADLALALGPKVSLSFGFDHFSGNVLGGPKYVENRESLRITYRPRTKSAR